MIHKTGTSMWQNSQLTSLVLINQKYLTTEHAAIDHNQAES